MKKTKIKFVYEILMILLALISVSFIWIDAQTFYILDWSIWGIFVIDVGARFLKAENKIKFLKENPFDLIAIIPLDSIFRMARIARVFRIIRIISITSHFFKPIFNILHTNGLNKVLASTCLLIFISAIPIYLIEPKITTYEDALWWSIVTTTTVGYGDMSPVTLLGRFVAVILMIFGIGLLSMITGSVATYFIAIKKNQLPSSVEFIKTELDRFDHLTKNDIDALIVLLQKFSNDKKE